ncbi:MULTISPECIES: NAD(P)-dependent oxidoreductase [unclassified Nesterenkonia]|uniref:NAD(P)-dependent oxidoreductase n=1 Tax=unclassified Nesterenkonia TaxID=2629769 RepID=UPI000A19FBB7|nr:MULTISPECIES: NAD(P)H-binding protein [unclassified Nesterenkonia]MDS2174214.1 NAD(P)H-binding protein [Nesterenkonia sp. CL21]OSM43311.1 NAD-dependent epimerase [Nesterenkonia sp. PF2B19]
MAHIAVIGGTGHAGSHIAAEAARRGHHVTTVSRNGSDRTAPTDAAGQIHHIAGSAADAELVARLATDHDVIVLALPAAGEPGLSDHLRTVLPAAARGGSRVAVVGGAGGLRVSPDGPILMETADFPPEYRPEATAHREALDVLQQDTSGARWFYLSPGAMFGAELQIPSTGEYRTSDEVLLTDPDGRSQISGADYALALVDEIDRPAHENRRFHAAQ